MILYKGIKDDIFQIKPITGPAEKVCYCKTLKFSYTLNIAVIFLKFTQIDLQ